jgi:hypothetical protein
MRARAGICPNRNVLTPRPATLVVELAEDEEMMKRRGWKLIAHYNFYTADE